MPLYDLKVGTLRALRCPLKGGNTACYQGKYNVFFALHKNGNNVIT